MIKAVPEDFIVEKKAELPLRSRAEHRVYVLEKRHWGTLDLVHHPSRTLGLPLGRFSSGGKKDKHRRTRRFITIFFDDQGFRSYDPKRGFFAERILKSIAAAPFKFF